VKRIEIKIVNLIRPEAKWTNYGQVELELFKFFARVNLSEKFVLRRTEPVDVAKFWDEL